MRLLQDTQRLAPRPAGVDVVTPVQAATIRDGASGQAAASEAVTAAVEGDLIAASPTLAAKLEEIDGRITALEP